jgi:hypothetical protein
MSSPSILIARDGVACIGIDLPPAAPAPLQYAAEELRRFVQRRTGAKLPDGRVNGSAFVLRTADDADAPAWATEVNQASESYRIESDGECIYLVGADSAGLVYAVMDFLEKELDIGFAGLGETGIRCRLEPTLSVCPEARQCRPTLSYRGQNLCLPEDMGEALGGLSDIHLQRLDWMVQHRMNYALLDPNQRDDWQYIRRLYPEVKRRGLKVHWGHHNWNRWVSPSKYFDEHPEWFAMKDGQRMRTGGLGHSGGVEQLSLCTSNPEVAEVFADEVLKVCQEFSDIDVISLWCEDGTSMCECPQCEAMDELPAGTSYDTGSIGVQLAVSYRDRNKAARYLRFINAVARRVAKVEPTQRLSACFYHDIDEPPAGETIEPNVEPMLAHYFRCGRHTLQHEPCENEYYARLTRQWAEMAPGRLALYAYPYGVSSAAGLPWPVTRIMQQDWQWMSGLDLQGETQQAQSANFTIYGSNYAFLARLYWQPAAAYDELFQPYFRNLYESAAPSVLSIFALLEERALTPEVAEGDDELSKLFKQRGFVYSPELANCVIPTAVSIRRLLRQDDWQRLDDAMEEAFRLGDNERVRTNLTKLGSLIDYWRLMYRFYEAYESWSDACQAQTLEVASLCEECLKRFDAVLGHVERIPYPDVLAREVLRKYFFPYLRRSLLEGTDAAGRNMAQVAVGQAVDAQ